MRKTIYLGAFLLAAAGLTGCKEEPKEPVIHMELDGIRYELTTADMKAKVTGLGNGNLIHLSIPSTFVYDEETYTVISIKDDAFRNNTSIQDAIIPNTVTTMGEAAFFGCNQLAEISISTSLKTIEENTFRDCQSLTSVSIPNSVKTLGDQAFAGCSNLKDISLPSELTSIGEYVFDGCRSLKTLKLPQTLETIGEGAFRSSGLESLSIPPRVTSIGTDAILSCMGLKELTFEDSELPISLTNFYISASNTVYRVNNLYVGRNIKSKLEIFPTEKFTIAANVSELNFSFSTLDEDDTFDFYIYATTPPEGNLYMNYWCLNYCKVFVPAQSIEAYKANPFWGEFKNISAL